MANLKDDPLYNVIESGIKEDISVTFAAKRYRATIILIYAGIDAMASLAIPETQTEGGKADFVAWAETYIRFPCPEQLTGLDLYGARCALLHSYGFESRHSRKGDCREVSYVDRCVPEVRYAPSILPHDVVVSIEGLRDAFLTGLNRFLTATLADEQKALLVGNRLKKMVHLLPYDD
jgi:hypothetical protein